ncbi:heparinase II/III family protein [Paenibacillus sp. Soil787]|uniref:heparinase II/III family protein n=1 Tax=Paenibacillus sp. Soil787 TaxID=1736411 RepID=UPI000702FEC1|nr:heparinase II/III family protein [Paenibacillus sp. Soil787]KRF21499.1 hypothetical protein ASG93_09010 [Paenibacillus sp. Soil787]
MLNQLTFRQLKNALEETQHLPHVLFAEARSSERWKSVIEDGNYSSFWGKMKEQAAEIIEKPVRAPLFSEFTLFGDTGNRSIYESQWNKLYAGLHTFSMLLMMEDRPEWKTGLNNAIWNICNEYTWVWPAHVGLYHKDHSDGIWDQPALPRETVDLFAALSAFGLAETVSLHGDRLHPWVVHRVKEEIDRRIFQVYFHTPIPQKWEMDTNNWPAVCASSIGAAAIYLIEDGEKLAGMLWRVIGVLRNYFSGFDEQGSTPEGPAYWQVGFSYFVYFAELLKERTHGKILLLTDEKVESISQFPQFCMLSDGKVINFSDSSDKVQFNIGLIHRLQDYVPSLQLPSETYRQHPVLNSWVDAARNMLWSPESTPSDLALDLEGVQERIYTGNQWFISKVKNSNGRFSAFAAKGGNNDEPHNHNDLGHFILHVDGENVLADIGLGDIYMYSKQYFHPQYRYEMINAGSHGHSVPIVDGCRQAYGEQYRANIITSQTSEDEVQFVLDLTKAYNCDSLELLTREFIWKRPKNENPQLVITDMASFSKVPESFQEVFISSVLPQDTGIGRIRMNSVTLVYNLDQWRAEVEPIQSAAHTLSFYRVKLTCRNPGLEVASVCRFEIEHS